MLELISILASLVLLVVTPIQTAQICEGKISPKYKGTPQAYAAAFRKQVGLFVWLGAVFGVLDIVMIFMDTEPGEWIVKAVAAALWIGVSAVSVYSSQRLARLLAPANGDGASA
jgi:hypothetical protein